MPVPTLIPEDFRRGPFTTEAFRHAGLSPRLLEGQRFIRLHPRVWVHRDHELTLADRLHSARLTLPSRAQLSHRTRLELLGLDDLREPFHFTIAGDLHLDVPGVTLHRTVKLPPTDAHGVIPVSAWVQDCSQVSPVEAIASADWLIHHRHATRQSLAEAARLDEWRPGAQRARRALPFTDGASRSLPESRVRCAIVAAGLPRPEVNADVVVDGLRIAIADLLWKQWRLLVEYEGRQHAEDSRQFNRDLVRYADLRAAGYDYIQVTAAMLARPEAMVRTIGRRLRDRGYDGPEPNFGERWTAWHACPDRP